MNWSLDDPRWLGLIVVGIACAVLGWRWLRAVPAMRRAPALLARVLLLTAAALALAGAHADRTSDRVAVVAVVDVSGSVRSYADFGLDDLGQPLTAQDAAWNLLARMAKGRGPDDPFGLVIFDGRAAALATPGVDDPLTRSPAVTPVDGTDLPAALRLARAMLPSDAAGRIVLISDARSTTGPLDEIPADIAIDVAPISYKVERETIVESFDLPARSTPGAEVDARVILRSSGPARGTLTVLREGRPIDLTPGAEGDGLRVEIEPGRHVIPVRFSLPDGRVHRYEAVFEPDRAVGDRPGTSAVLFGDTSTANNRAPAFTITRNPGSILLVDGTGSGESSALVRTLRAAGREVEVTAPAAFPVDLLTLEGHHLVILDDVPLDALPNGSAARLNAYTRSFGGGVVFVGGRNALTAGGWRGSAIEDALPVRLEVPDRVVMPEVAVVIVLDRSGSMSQPVMGSSRSQQSIANEAAAGAIDTLDPNDLVGVIAFANNPSVIVPLGRNLDPAATRAAVTGISSGGGTNLALALETAANQLARVESKTKHVIVLTDGQSQEAERLPTLAADLLRSGARVSTIAIGDESDADTLRTVAEKGGGVFYRVMNPSVLPQVFIKAIRVLREPTVRDTPFNPIVIDPDSPAMLGTAGIPTLGGVVLTTRRERADTPVVTPDDEPVVALWPVELGRAAVVTTDAHSWASAWIEELSFARFWTNLTAWAARAIEDSPGELRMIARGDTADMTYEAQDADGAPLDGMQVVVNLYTPDGTAREVPLRQTGPGRYEGQARSLPEGVIVAAARAQSGEQPLAPAISGVQVRAGAEDMHLASDDAALIRLAQRTGGRVIDWASPPPAFERFEQPRVLRSALWPSLLIASLVLFLIDIAMRRVAWDRWVSDAREGTVAATANASSATVSTLRAGRVRGEQPTVTHEIRLDAEAERLRTERDRARRVMEEARRRAGPTATDEPVTKAEQPDARDVSLAEPDSGLLAAKRRARQRFDDNGS